MKIRTSFGVKSGGTRLSRFSDPQRVEAQSPLFLMYGIAKTDSASISSFRRVGTQVPPPPPCSLGEVLLL